MPKSTRHCSMSGGRDAARGEEHTRLGKRRRPWGCNHTPPQMAMLHCSTHNVGKPTYKGQTYTDFLKSSFTFRHKYISGKRFFFFFRGNISHLIQKFACLGHFFMLLRMFFSNWHTFGLSPETIWILGSGS